MLLQSVGTTALSVLVIGSIGLPWAPHEVLSAARVQASQLPGYGLVAACPVVASPTAMQHVSHGDVLVATADVKPMARSGVIVEPSGQTVFYAGPAPKPLDTAGQKSKPAPQHPAPSSAIVSGGDVTTRPATPPHPAAKAKSTTRVWTVQVASFETLDEAQTLEMSLCQRGYDARIVGSNRPPFTVQVGAYASSDSAMVVARHLTSRELTAFVTQANR